MQTISISIQGYLLKHFKFKKKNKVKSKIEMALGVEFQIQMKPIQWRRSKEIGLCLTIALNLMLTLFRVDLTKLFRKSEPEIGAERREKTIQNCVHCIV